MLLKLLISIGISIGLLGLLIHFTLSSTDPSVWSSLVAALATFPPLFLLLYFCTSLLRTLLQSMRYRLLIRASEPEVPTLFHMYLVVLSRNMFVDMLPARLGELSYIAMLNRGYRVSGESCVSSLTIAFVFDLIALGVLIGVLLLIQLVGGDFQPWMAGVLIMLALLILFLLILLYPAITLANRIILKIAWLQRGITGKAVDLLVRIEQALDASRRAGITRRLLSLSIGVRIFKYLGLYGLFVGVAATQFPELSTRIHWVLPALVSAEAGASLPVPAFMGFGTYEAGGMLALTALGASASISLLVMLAMHVISQIVDYLLGAIGLILFVFKTGKLDGLKAATMRTSWKIWVPAAALLCGALLLLVYEMRAVKKRGSLTPPGQGQPVAAVPAVGGDVLKRLDGFLVWSSNRSGNHDIWMYSFGDGETRQLTTHPHTEYFSRVSPDGSRIVFARSHEPWVSQRNVYAWDIYMLDLRSGKEALLARNGNVPNWSKDGKSVYFQRNATQVVSVDIKSGKETLIHQSGASIDVPPETELQTPHLSGDDKLAVTFRRTQRATAIVSQEGAVNITGNGCQLLWAPDDSFLVKVDDGGRGGNTIYKVTPETREAAAWFDAEGDYSHEYFPRIDPTGDVLVYGASAEGHEHDTADYEIFLWAIGSPAADAVRITHHTGNDCWPDIYLNKPMR